VILALLAALVVAMMFLGASAWVYGAVALACLAVMWLVTR
jgi:hypothetical protein